MLRRIAKRRTNLCASTTVQNKFQNLSFGSPIMKNSFVRLHVSWLLGTDTQQNAAARRMLPVGQLER